MANNEHVKLDEVHTAREPGFTPLFDAERFKAAGVPTLDDLRLAYKTPEDKAARVAELKKQISAGSLATLRLKAEIGGLIFLAIASAQGGAKTGLSGRVFGISKDTAYRYIDLYKYFVWGYEAARDTATAKGDAEAVDLGDISIDEVIRIGKEKAAAAGAVITRTYSGGDVLLIDPSAAEPIAMASVPANLAARKGSRDGYWEVLPNAPMSKGFVHREVNGPKQPYFTLRGMGFECRLLIAKIDEKNKKVATPHIPDWEALRALFDFKARKPEIIKLPLIDPFAARVIWSDHSDVPLDPAKTEVVTLGEPVPGVIAFREKTAEAPTGFFEIGGEELHGKWILASLGEGGILKQPVVQSFLNLRPTKEGGLINFSSFDLLKAAQKIKADADNEGWIELDKKTIEESFESEQAWRVGVSKAKLCAMPATTPDTPSDRAIDNGFARRSGDKVLWNIDKLRTEFARVAEFDNITSHDLEILHRFKVLERLGYAVPGDGATSKAVEEGLALWAGGLEWHKAKVLNRLNQPDAAAIHEDRWQRVERTFTPDSQTGDEGDDDDTWEVTGEEADDRDTSEVLEPAEDGSVEVPGPVPEEVGVRDTPEVTEPLNGTHTDVVEPAATEDPSITPDVFELGVDETTFEEAPYDPAPTIDLSATLRVRFKVAYDSEEAKTDEAGPERVGNALIAKLAHINRLAVQLAVIPPSRHNMAEHSRRLRKASAEALDLLEKLLRPYVHVQDIQPVKGSRTH